MTRLPRVILLLGATASLALLAGCDDDKKQQAQRQAEGSAQHGKLYKDLDACLNDASDMTAVTACRDGYRQALQQMAQAPQFEQKARCEDVYGPGNCVPRGSVVEGGGGGFVPFMMGYMLGGGFGGRTYYQPVFIDRGGATYAGGSVISNPSWSGGAPAAAAAPGNRGPMPAASASSSVSRGGFGGTASTSARSSMGG